MQGSILAAASGQSGIWMSRSYTLKFVHRLSSPEKAEPCKETRWHAKDVYEFLCPDCTGQ